MESSGYAYGHIEISLTDKLTPKCSISTPTLLITVDLSTCDES